MQQSDANASAPTSNGGSPTSTLAPTPSPTPTSDSIYNSIKQAITTTGAINENIGQNAINYGAGVLAVGIGADATPASAPAGVRLNAIGFALTGAGAATYLRGTIESAIGGAM